MMNLSQGDMAITDEPNLDGANADDRTSPANSPTSLRPIIRSLHSYD